MKNKSNLPVHVFNEIKLKLSDYSSKGGSFRAEQTSRIQNILADIFKHSPECRRKVVCIGRKQIIGYWKRTEHETDKTRREKHSALCILFSAFGMKEPPEPRILGNNRKLTEKEQMSHEIKLLKAENHKLAAENERLKARN